jgi:hypothetical protein
MWQPSRFIFRAGSYFSHVAPRGCSCGGASTPWTLECTLVLNAISKSTPHRGRPTAQGPTLLRPSFPSRFFLLPYPPECAPNQVGRPRPSTLAPPTRADPHRDAASGYLETAPVSPICHGLSRGAVSPMHHGMPSCHVPSFSEPWPIIIRMLCIYFYCDVIFVIIVIFCFFYPFLFSFPIFIFFPFRDFILFLFFLYLLKKFRHAGPEMSVSWETATPW